MIRFDPELLRKTLTMLPKRLALAFSVACAQRVSGGYHLFAKLRQRDTKRFDLILNQLWNAAIEAGEIYQEDEVMSVIYTLFPVQDEFAQEYAYAEDALRSLQYSLLLASAGDAMNGAYAAQVAYDAVDQYVIRRDRIQLNESSSERKILGSDVVQSELMAQLSDLSLLRESVGADEKSVVLEVKKRALENQHRFEIFS